MYCKTINVYTKSVRLPSPDGKDHAGYAKEGPADEQGDDDDDRMQADDGPMT